ncbi:MAG: molybdopterin-dependent oxidoreductase [Ardenticatenaceae bacterium]|nr:molybdopterin-dependent oxidoreductase [Ardenticatenaceae bacterium]
MDFLVVQELFLTETAAAADVITPSTKLGGQEGTYTSGERRVP